MSTPVIVFLDRDTIPQHIQITSPSFEHHWQAYPSTQSEQTVERLRNADIAITNKVVLSADILAQLPNLKLVAVAATGFNNVDIDYCREHNIAVCNVPGYSNRSVPEHVLAMMFALRRNLLGYHTDIMKGEWQRNNLFCFFTHPIGDIAGSTMGIIGGGTLGQAVASLAKAVGMQVLFAERKGAAHCRPGYQPFEDVLSQADVVSLHCLLTEETRNLIDEAEFELMKPTALLINTGRGGLVNETALVNALTQAKIAGAGVDVFTQEPADRSNPLIAHSHLPNLLLTPHVAWGSDSAIHKMLGILMDNLLAFTQGKRQNRIV